MEFCLFDKVKTKNIDGKYNNTSGKVVKIYPNIDVEPVYMIEYDVPFGCCTQGMFKESELIKN